MKSVLQFLFSEWVIDLYQWFFVPKNLWYASQNNGCTMVVPARKVEKKIRSCREYWKFGRPERLHVFKDSDFRPILFSDRPEYIQGIDRESNRVSGGISGSMQEFNTFCHMFPVELTVLKVPGSHELSWQGTVFGKLDNPDDFKEVIRYARDNCR